MTATTNIDIPARLDAAQKQLDDTRRQLETAKEELNKPFTMETELAAKAGRLAELDSQLNMDNAPDMGARDVSSACSENSGQNAHIHGEAGNTAERQEDYAITTKIYGLEDEMQEREIADQVYAEPETDEQESQYCELEMDEPEPQYCESERPARNADIQQALRSALETDFGKLPPNIVIGVMPDQHYGYRSGAGLGR